MEQQEDVAQLTDEERTQSNEEGKHKLEKEEPGTEEDEAEKEDDEDEDELEDDMFLGSRIDADMHDVPKQNLFRKGRKGALKKNKTVIGRGLMANFFDVWNSYAGYRHVPGNHEPFPQTEQRIKEAIMAEKRVIRATQKYAVENSLTEAAASKKVYGMLDDMVAKWNSTVARSFQYLMTKVLKRLFVAVNVDKEGIEKIKKLEASGVPVVLMPTHKSHIDYIVMSDICWCYNISLPYIAAGENLNVPIVGYIFRTVGAFFIRRQFGVDPLYALLFESYIEQILLEGSLMEFFVEGGRSRSGKVLRPKTGLLSVITTHILRGRVEDAYVVPVAISYDKVIEGEAHSRELFGANKKPETLTGMLSSAKFLKNKFGTVDVNFGPPLSIAQYIADHKLQKLKKPKHDPHARRLIQALAYRVLYECNKVSVVRPTALIATALLTHPGRGMGITQLRQKVDQIQRDIVSRGGKVARLKDEKEHSLSTLTVIEEALEVLGDLVRRHVTKLEQFFVPKKRLELTFYKNSIIHWFVSDGVVAVALYAAMKPGHATTATNAMAPPGATDVVAPNNHAPKGPFTVSKKVLLEHVKFVSQLLKLEFIYKPSPDISENLEHTLVQMVHRGILTIEEGGEFVSLNTSDTAKESFLFLCSLFWPYIDSYWLVLNTMRSLLPDIVVEESNFLNRTRTFGLIMYYDGELNFLEAISSEPLSNALTLFAEWKVTRNERVFQSKVTTIKLRNAYDETKLNALIDKIGCYRRDTFRGLREGRLEGTDTEAELRKKRFPKALAKM